MPSSTPLRIAVIGGGLSGLAAAHRLLELGDAQQRRVDVTLFEAADRVGGVVGSIERDGYLIDLGADNFLTNKPGAVGLCQRLGLQDRLQTNDPQFRGAHVVRNGRPVKVPEGFQLIGPTSLWSVLTTPLFSPLGKLRMAWELVVPPRQPVAEDDDESLASFVRRRFGKEALDRLVQPLVGGIYTADPERLSLAATMPRFIDFERRHGSVIRGLRAAPTQDEPRDTRSGGARYGLFVGLRGGMNDLLQALQQRLSGRCHFVCSARVTSVKSAASASTSTSGVASTGYTVQWQTAVDRDAPGKANFDHVVIALAAPQASRLIESINPLLAQTLGSIEYASSAIVVSGHRTDQVRHPLDSFGLVVPHQERRRILATSFSSRKFPNRAPAGRVLLRTFVGGAMQPELYDLDDAAIKQLVRDELHALLGVTGEPDFMLLQRYPGAMPQYTVGHLSRVQRIEFLLAGHPGLHLVGNAYRGVGVPDVIAVAEAAAESILTTSSDPSH